MALLRITTLALLLTALTGAGCKKNEAPPSGLKVGLVTDVGGRGDQSFNDSALRGLELWAAGQKFSGSSYTPATAQEVQATVPKELQSLQGPVTPLEVTPLVLQSKSQEDYEPNLQLLVGQSSELVIATGFLLENAVESVAKRNPGSKFLLIDSAILDEKGRPYTLPNVRTVVFREEEGSFLVGALAGLVTKTGKVAFVGGMQLPLIQHFEAGFRAGLAATNPKAAQDAFIGYTGSFDNVGAGKQVAQDVIAKGADVIFQAAGSDGLGVIQAVKEARAQGKSVFVVGVDSDQAHLAPDAVLTSMVKHVDLAVYESIRDLKAQKLSGGDLSLGLKEGGVGLAELRLDFPHKAEFLARIDALRQQIIDGKIKVPASPQQLSAFKGSP